LENGPELGASCVINSIPNLAICPHIMKGLLTLFAFSYNIFGDYQDSSTGSCPGLDHVKSSDTLAQDGHIGRAGRDTVKFR